MCENACEGYLDTDIRIEISTYSIINFKLVLYFGTRVVIPFSEIKILEISSDDKILHVATSVGNYIITFSEEGSENFFKVYSHYLEWNNK